MMKQARIFLVSLVSFFLLTLSVSVHAENRQVTVYNRTSLDIYKIQATNVADDDWGRDWLGSSTILNSGYNIKINFSDGTGACRFDLRVTFENGDVAMVRNFNVCRASEWNIRNSDIQ